MKLYKLSHVCVQSPLHFIVTKKWVTDTLFQIVTFVFLLVIDHISFAEVRKITHVHIGVAEMSVVLFYSLSWI